MLPKEEEQSFLPYADDPGEENLSQRSHRPTSRANMWMHALISMVATSLFWIFVILLITPANPHRRGAPPSTGTSKLNSVGRHNITSSAKLITCGGSVAEARQRGCKYDILLNNWVPAPCYDDEFLAEYKDDGSWGAYADKNMTQRLTVEQMSQRDFYYTSIRDHVNHCAIMWRKQFWALYEERPAFDTVIANPGHTEHCSQYLMDVMEAKWTEPTRTEMGFAGCWVRNK